jgi:hypothetical protein
MQVLQGLDHPNVVRSVSLPLAPPLFPLPSRAPRRHLCLTCSFFPRRSNSMNGSSPGQNTTSLSSSPSAESSSSGSASAAISRSEMPSPCFGTFASPSVPHARLKNNDCFFFPLQFCVIRRDVPARPRHRPSGSQVRGSPLFSSPSARSLDLTSGLWIDRRTSSSVQRTHRQIL